MVQLSERPESGFQLVDVHGLCGGGDRLRRQLHIQPATQKYGEVR